MTDIIAPDNACTEASGLTADLRATHPDKDRWPTETLLLAAQHMLTAIDRGHFADPFLPESAFTQGLRDAVAREIAGGPDYTFHNDGPPVAVGDRVVVFSRGREQRVSVAALVHEKPPFETKSILRMVEMPPAEMMSPENSTAMLDLPDDDLPL